jgi:hypothetical protein
LQAWVEQAEKTIKIERNEELIASLQARGGKVPTPRGPRGAGKSPIKVSKAVKKEKKAEDEE